MLRESKIWSYSDLPHPLEVTGKVKFSPKQAQRMQDAVQQRADF